MPYENEEPKSVLPPSGESIERPFFAYGIFKPGQIAFSKIRDCVSHLESHSVPREMLMRDGVPLIENIESSYSTKGYKMYFNEDDCKTAYDTISETEPYRLYEWDVIEVDGDMCNVLVGKSLKKGTYHSHDINGRYVDDYDWSDDPFFKALPEYIHDELKNRRYLDNYFYKIQMYYMILWSAIDRYCALKYGAHNNQTHLRKAFANDKVFIDSLKSRLDEDDIKYREKVYSSDLLNPFKLTTKNPWYAINYYFTLRCNVVHRGKEPGNNINTLHRSLEELLGIFDDVIQRTFYE